MAKRLPRSVYRAINREVTPAFGRWAQKNYEMGGKKLIAKVYAGEGGGTAKKPNVSSAGARGPGQFIPSTRAAYVAQYGIDPWRSDREAVKGTMIHLKGTGVAGYNPGMSSYESYILGQDVDTSPLRTGGKRGAPPARSPGRSETSKRSYTTPGVDRSAARSEARLAALTGTRGLPDFDDLLALKSTLSSLKDTPGRKRTVVTRSRTPARGKPRVKGEVKDYQRAGKLIEREVLPIAQQLGIQVTPRSVRAANASHGPTVSGSRSDHQGPYEQVWAADMSNGSAPTKEMDKLARRIAKKFGIPWSGSGLVTHERNGYRYQLIYKTNEGGNHFNHVHFAARKI